MYKMTDLIKDEIAPLIDHKVKSGLRVEPNWVTQEIMAGRQEIEGCDRDFYLCLGKFAIRDQVRRRIDKFKLKPENQTDDDSQIDRQLVLEGYKRVQRSYVFEEPVMKDGKPVMDEDGKPVVMTVAIPIETMTTPQRIAKIKELRSMGAGCYLHADELERYDELHPNDEEQAA
jgi:hypothetical protein